MVSYWTSFARSGNPNSGKTPNWPALQEKTDQQSWQSLQLPRPVTIAGADFSSRHKCGFWNQFSK
jgi:para-nitrobenzyl esterase